MTKTKLGFWSIVLLAINSIIGSGIFLTPGSVVSMVGSKAPLAYLLAAIFASCLAITFAAAAKYVNKSGAAYSYAKAAYGENMGFYMGVVRFFSASVAWGVMAVGVIRSLYSIFGWSQSFKNITLGFVILMLIIMVINLLGRRVFTIINDLSTIGKVGALLLIIVAGTYVLLKTGENHFNELDHLKNAAGKSLVPAFTTSGFVMAVISAFYAFTGFEAVATGSEDMKSPEKNLPRAIPLAILIIADIYIATIAIAMMVNPEAMVTTKQVVALVAIFHNKVLQNVILAGAVVSMFGINVASSFHTPRVLEAMANEHQVPQFIAKRTRLNFPLISFFITLLLAMGIPMAFEYNLPTIIVISATVRFFEFIVIPLGVIRFYFGRNVEVILPAQKNLFTDVILPVVSVIITIFLLSRYEWVAEFSTVSHGQTHANWFAIFGMFFGFVLLPAILFWLTRRERAENVVK
ncbi:APC family permease [Lactobacillaceae bacterium 24-114]